ncbi:hypothetical protein QBC35DRAFT_444904 [Podospora australis]|uniref:Uncharacterized protein n=1 Tax=Podospora australis TaxID=1536484 RepID=A0AAN7AE78_9PEZI|nr:hypothetical protein QBC35DRAFT_444904 [Podospora australis]
MSDQSAPDLSLPTTAPGSVGNYYDGAVEMLPAALYTLVELSDNELQELQRDCESQSNIETPGSSVRLAAPRYRFVGEPLRAVYDYHLEQNPPSAREHSLDPIHFVVACSRDWKTQGVLVITLDDEDNNDGEFKTDAVKCKAEDVGINLIGLQLANTDWQEFKDSYALPSASGEDGDDGDDDDDDDKNDEGDHRQEPTPPDDPGSPTSGPIPPSAPAHRDSVPIAVYAVPGVDVQKLIQTLEPGGSRKRPENFNCRLQAILSSSDPVQEAMDLHPQRCVRNNFLHKFLFLIADTTDFSESGILLASLGGQVKDKQFPARETQRVACTAKSAVQDAICTMAQGLRGWTPPEGEHCVYVFRWKRRHDEKKQPPERIAPLLDAKWDRPGRPEGEERILLAGSRFVREPGQLPKMVEWDLRAAVEKWPEVCWEQRFRRNFVRKYFLCVDTGDAEKEGVMVVKIDWDGDISGGKEKAKELDLTTKVGKMRVGVGEAWNVVNGLVEGTREWEGVKAEWRMPIKLTSDGQGGEKSSS